MEIFLGHMCFWVPCAHCKFVCCEKAGEGLFGEARIAVITASRRGLQAKKGLGKEGQSGEKRSAGHSFVLPLSHHQSLCWALGDISMNSRSFPG